MKSKRNLVLLVVVMLACFSITTTISCTHKTQQLVVSFSGDILPILTANCTLSSSCHAGANSTNEQTNFDVDSAYITIIRKNLVNGTNPAASLLYAEVNENQMPLAPYQPLSDAEKSLILQWIQQGAKNN